MIQTIKTLLAVLVIVTTVGFVAANSITPQVSAAGGCLVGQGSARNGFPGSGGGGPGGVLHTPGSEQCVPTSNPLLGGGSVPP